MTAVVSADKLQETARSIDSRYPDICGNRRSKALLNAVFMSAIEEGLPNDWSTADLAARITRRVICRTNGE